MSEVTRKISRVIKRVMWFGGLAVLFYLLSFIWVYTILDSHILGLALRQAPKAMTHLVECANAFRDKDPDDYFPKSLASLVEREAECIEQRPLGPWALKDDEVQVRLYRITYVPETNEAGLATSFKVHARPFRYRHYLGNLLWWVILGSITQRSLVTNEAGIVHYTKEDRAATLDDPELEEKYVQ